MGLLKPTVMRVEIVGTTVEMRFGNVPITIDYETAIRLSEMLGIAGRQAKAAAGDKSVRIRGYGLLTDRVVEEKKAQHERDSTAAFRPIK